METLSWIIDNLKMGQVAKATLGIEDFWFITLTKGHQIRFCGENGENVSDLVGLTYSNLKARYEIIK